MAITVQVLRFSEKCAISVQLARMLCYIMSHVIYECECAGVKNHGMKMREQQELRQSMWSVRPTLVPLYFLLFTLAVVSGKVMFVWYEVKVVTSDGPFETWIGIIQGVGWVGLASAVGAFTLTETMEYAMVMANWFRQQYLEPLKERQRKEGREQGLEEGRVAGLEEGRVEGREEGRVAGRVEGRAELLAEIREWDRRRREAEARNEPFDEPPPYAQNGHHN